MNILPKKSWHVRNKNNIEKVRKDEENAANEEKEKRRKIAVAECEARTELLRDRARERKSGNRDVEIDYVESLQNTSVALPASSCNKHINFFEDLEQGKKIGGKNAEHEREKREEKEAAEKAIGLLTYLGQGSVESQTDKPWYFNPSGRSKSTSQDHKIVENSAKSEMELKRKRSLDPLQAMQKYVSIAEKVHASQNSGNDRHSKHRKVNTEYAPVMRTGSVSAGTATRPQSTHGPAPPKTIEQLRAERLKREQQERLKEKQLLSKVRGEVQPIEQETQNNDRGRYNSQFNPDFVRRPKQSRTLDHRPY